MTAPLHRYEQHAYAAILAACFAFWLWQIHKPVANADAAIPSESLIEQSYAAQELIMHGAAVSKPKRPAPKPEKPSMPECQGEYDCGGTGARDARKNEPECEKTKENSEKCRAYMKPFMTAHLERSKGYKPTQADIEDYAGTLPSQVAKAVTSRSW
jgi:hypothetical protein